MMAKKIKRVLFCLFYNDYRELEWCLPVINKYMEAGVEVDVLLPAMPCTSRQLIMKYWLEHYCFRVLYACDIYYGKKSKYLHGLYRQADNSNNIFGRFLSIFLTPGNRASMWSGLHYIHRVLAFRGLNQLAGEIDLVYIPEGGVSKLRKNSLADFVYNAFSEKNIPIVGYVISAFSETRNIVESNKKLSNLMVRTREDKLLCDVAGINATVSGAPRYSRDWVHETSEYFDQNTKARDIKAAALGKKIALVMLKNRSGLVKNVITEEEHSDLRKKLINDLYKQGYYLIIKPHPGGKLKRLYRDIENIPSDIYTITEIPPLYLASIAEYCFFEMPSNGIMDCLAVGKKPYWVYPFFLKGEMGVEEYAQILSTRLIDSGFPTEFFNYVEINMPDNKENNNSDSVSADVYSSFSELMALDTDLIGAIRNCEEMLCQG